MKYYLGIDPGTEGGTAATNKKGDLKLLLPHSKYSFEQYKDKLLKLKGNIEYAVLENVWGLPGQNAAANSKLDRSFGRCQATLVFLECAYDLVIAKSWQKYFDLYKEKGENKNSWKNRLAEYARTLYPSNTIRKEEADSVLIAHYALKISKNEKQHK